ncbi:MAG: LPS assembly lipoprotein LptE [Pseudomonadota bacterium]
MNTGSAQKTIAKARTSFLCLLLAFVVVGCGFQLRGQQTLPFSSIAILGSPTYVTIAQLNQTVATISSTQIVNNLADADAALYVMSENREKVISALSAAGRVREYELRLRVAFQLIDKKGEELIRPTEIMLFRLLPYDESQVLSKGEEEALLYRDMQSDIAAQIMRRVAAAKPNP